MSNFFSGAHVFCLLLHNNKHFDSFDLHSDPPQTLKKKLRWLNPASASTSPRADSPKLSSHLLYSMYHNYFTRALLQKFEIKIFIQHLDLNPPTSGSHIPARASPFTYSDLHLYNWLQTLWKVWLQVQPSAGTLLQWISNKLSLYGITSE